MHVAATLSLYIARQFVAAVLAMLAALAGLVCLFDFIELLRRSATKPDATFGLVVEIAALRLPYVAMQILPFAVLLGGIVAFWRLTRSSELIVARAAGVSAWQFLSAPLASALLLGAAATGVVSPLSSVMLARAETLDNVYLRSSGGPAALTGGQLWLRQADHGLDPQGVAILLARSVTLRGKVLQSSDVSVFRLSADDKLLQRVEATHAQLVPGAWVLEDARTMLPDHLPEPVGTMRLSTDLTVSRVQESFASPDTLSVWALPDFIALLDRSGFSSVRHRLHLQSLLALRLLEQRGRAELGRVAKAVLAAGGPFTELDEAARIAVVTRLEAAEPELFGWLRDVAYVTYYETPFVADVINAKGHVYDLRPHTKGYPVRRFDLDRDTPRHGRGHYVPTEAVRRVDTSTLDLASERTLAWGLKR